MKPIFIRKTFDSEGEFVAWLKSELQRLRPVDLSDREKEAVAFIKAYRAEHGKMPSYDEIAAALSLKSKSGVFRIMDQLKSRGHVSWRPGRARSLVLLRD